MSYMKMMAMTNGNRSNRSNRQNEYEHYRDPFAEDSYEAEHRDMRRQIGYGAGEMESRRRRGDDGRYMADRDMRRSEGGSNMVDMQAYKQQQKDYQIGGTFNMTSGGGKAQKLTKQMAEEWVDSMESEDSEKPEGETFTMEQAKQLAKKIGYETEGQKAIDFYAILNAVYSDYCKVAEKYDVDEPEFYACMAKAWLEDKDAVRNKAGAYYQHIVKK